MTPFHVGMRVVCVDDCVRRYESLAQNVDFTGDLNGLSKGEVYTVREVSPFPWNEDVLTLKLVEIVRPLGDGVIIETGFVAARFRPAHENRMDELRTLLAPVPSKELVQS